MDPKNALALGGLGCLACAGCFALIAIPNFIEMQARAKRAEVPSNVDGIKTAELAYDAAFDEFVPTAPHPRRVQELTGDAVPWRNPTDFNTLGWSSDGDVRGTYWVDVPPDGSDFTVHGAVDIDGDGTVAHYTATKSINTVFLNNNDTF